MLPSDANKAGVTLTLSASFIDAIRRVRTWEKRIALLIHHRSGAERVVLSPDTPVTVGRASPSQVRIHDDSLSREHARFTQSGHSVLVEDLRSTNGTWTRGARITSTDVGPGDEVMLGNVLVSIRAIPEDEDGGPGVTSHERLRVALEEEVVRARHFGRSCALLMVRSVGGGGAHVSHSCDQIRALLRPVDRIGLYSSDAVAILLVETGAEAALKMAHAIVARSGAEGHDALLVGVTPFPDAATTAEKLLEMCWAALSRTTPEHPVQAAPLGAWTRAGAGDQAGDNDEPVAVSPMMVELFSIATKLSRSSIPVLLLGETGTGKEVLARTLHKRGPRRARPLVCVNCGAIPQQLVESTLFGHEKGAFTGASQQQRGIFEAADGGSVFLDEIGELPPAAQAALLRVLETHRITRVGSSRELEIDVRVIAATHRNLEAMCASGAFRLDLLYRLNAMTLTIPPLRARPEEIEPLALRFLDQANKSSGRSILGFAPEALRLLRGYAWPGNSRELRNAIERAVAIADASWIGEQDLPERVRAEPDAERPAAHEHDEPELAGLHAGVDLKERLRRYEADLVVAALRDAGWNQSEAARTLGMPLRTLVHRIKILGIKKLGYGSGGDTA